MGIPSQLSSGLLLEDRGLLIRWGEIPDPQGETKYFTWRDAVILDGMKATVVAPAKVPLEVIHVHPAFLDGAKTETEQFDLALQDLTARVGPPTRRRKTESSLAAGLFYPEASWTFDAVTIRARVLENVGAAYIPYFELTVRRRSTR